MSDNIKVAIRLRPLISKEIEQNAQVYWATKNQEVVFQKGSPATAFYFDRVFDTNEGNQIVYQDLCAPIVTSVMDGFNGTIFAYGQTSSGKTYTMTGDCGIVQNAICDIFTAIDNMPDREFLLRVSYMEIYNEMVLDLLAPESKNLKIQEDMDGVVSVVGLTEIEVKDPQQVYEALKIGEGCRSFGETRANEKSSRSHAIFRMIVESRMRSVDIDDDVSVAQLNLVDLAGSERASQANAADRFKEGIHINKSLLILTQVICQLSEGDRQHVCYRDSKLTRILQNSLGGNARTVIICTVTPASRGQTQSTLKFASRAKCIKNKPVVNLVTTDKALLKRYIKEIKKLSEQLMEVQKNSGSDDPEMLRKELEENRKQNQDLKEQIQALKEKFVVSQWKTQVVACKNKINRRETWCFGLQNRKRSSASEKSMGFLKPLPILHEEDSPEPISPDLTLFESAGNISFSTSTDTMQSPLNKEVEASTQTVDTYYCNKALFKNVKILLHHLASEAHRASKLETELNELREFTHLEKQFQDSGILQKEKLKALEEEMQTLKTKNEELLMENCKLNNDCKHAEDRIAMLQSEVHESLTQRSRLVHSHAHSDNLVTKDEKYVQVEVSKSEKSGQVSVDKSEKSVQCEVAKCEKSVEVEQMFFCDGNSESSSDLKKNDCVDIALDVAVTGSNATSNCEASKNEEQDVNVDTDSPAEELQEKLEYLKSIIADCESMLDECHISALESDNLSDKEEYIGQHLLEKGIRLECEHKVKELQRINDMLTEELNTKKGKIELLCSNQVKYLDQLNAMRELIDCMKSKLDEKEENILKWQKEACDVCEAYLNDMEVNRKEREKLSQEIVRRHAELVQLQKSNEEMTSKMFKLENYANDVQAEKNKLFIKNEELKSKIKTMDSILKSQDDKIHCLICEMEKINCSYDAKIGELSAKYEAKLTSFKEEISAIHQNERDEQEKILTDSFNMKMKRRIEELTHEHRLEKLKVEENALRLTGSFKEEVLRMISAHKQFLDAKISGKQLLSHVAVSNLELQGSCGESNEKDNTRVLELEKTLDETISKMETNNLEFGNQITSLKSENDLLKSLNAELSLRTNKVKQMEDDISQLKAHREGLAEESHTLRAEAEQQNETIKKVEHEVLQLKAEKEASVAENQKLSAEVQELNETLKQLEQEVSLLRTEKNVALEESQKFSAEVEELNGTLKQLEQEVSQLKTEKNVALEENQKLSAEVEELNGTLKQLEQEVSQLKTEKDVAVEAKQKFNAEVEQQNETLKKLEQEILQLKANKEASLRENELEVKQQSEFMKHLEAESSIDDSTKSYSSDNSTPLDNLSVLLPCEKKWTDMMQSKESIFCDKKPAELAFENRQLQQKVRSLQEEKGLFQHKLSSYRNEIRKLQENIESQTDRAVNKSSDKKQVMNEVSNNVPFAESNECFQIVLKQKDRQIRRLEKERTKLIELLTSRKHLNLEKDPALSPTKENHELNSEKKYELNLDSDEIDENDKKIAEIAFENQQFIRLRKHDRYSSLNPECKQQ